MIEFGKWKYYSDSFSFYRNFLKCQLQAGSRNCFNFPRILFHHDPTTSHWNWPAEIKRKKKLIFSRFVTLWAQRAESKIYNSNRYIDNMSLIFSKPKLYYRESPFLKYNKVHYQIHLWCLKAQRTKEYEINLLQNLTGLVKDLLQTPFFSLVCQYIERTYMDGWPFLSFDLLLLFRLVEKTCRRDQ